jgi:hypothetical protein
MKKIFLESIADHFDGELQQRSARANGVSANYLAAFAADRTWVDYRVCWFWVAWLLGVWNGRTVSKP